MSATHPENFIGGKMPAHSLWQQLELAQCTLEFCSQFFNDHLGYTDARKWLESRGIKISIQALSGFYNSMSMRLRYAVMQADANAKERADELPADIEQQTRDRIKQHMFELSFMNLSEAQKLQLIEIQQNADGMKGNFELKKAKLDLDREKFQRTVVGKFLDWYEDKAAREILTSNTSHAEKTEKLGQALFGDLWA